MLRKLQRKMTFFCTGITGLILLIFSGIFLIMSEAKIREANEISFHENLDSLISYFESQELLSHTWLRQAEDSFHFLITITDNGRELVFQSLENDPQKERLTALARDAAPASLDISADAHFSLDPQVHGAFDLKAPDGQLYRAALIQVWKNAGVLDITVLQSYKIQEMQILNQRFLFGFVDFAALLLLGVFSCMFTWYMLRPLKKNQERQKLLTAAASLKLRAPLRSILSNNSALKTAAPEVIPEIIQNIHLEAETMSRLINDMLSLTNSGSNDLKIYPEHVEFDTLVLQVCEDLEPLAKKHGLHLKICFPNQALSPVVCDDQRMIQVLSILIGDVICSSVPGRTIRINLASKTGCLLLRITDRDEECQYKNQKSFHLISFHTGSTKNASKPELYFADKIIRRHKGSLGLKRDARGHTAFFVRLPFTPDSK